MPSRQNQKQPKQYDRSLSFQHLQSCRQLVGIMILRKKQLLNMVKIDHVVKTIINLQFMPKNVRSSFVKKMIKEIVLLLLSLNLIKTDSIYLKCLADFVANLLIVYIIKIESLQLKINL